MQGTPVQRDRQCQWCALVIITALLEQVPRFRVRLAAPVSMRQSAAPLSQILSVYHVQLGPITAWVEHQCLRIVQSAQWVLTLASSAPLL